MQDLTFKLKEKNVTGGLDAFYVTNKRVIPKTQIQSLIEESIISNIFEARGSFENQYRLVDIIASKILDFKQYQVNQDEKLSKFKEVGLIPVNTGIIVNWIKNINVVIYLSKNAGFDSCNASTILLNKDNYEFDKNNNPSCIINAVIRLFLRVKQDNLIPILNKIKSSIAHELLHMYEDYNRIVNTYNKETNGSQNIANICSSINYQKFIQISKKYSKNDDFENTVIASFFYNLYLLTPFEINAQVSSIYAELKDAAIPIEQLRDMIYKTTAYTSYANILYDNIDIYLALNDDVISKIRNECDNNGIHPFKINKKVGNKTWMKKVCDYMSFASQRALKSCARNASLYFEDLRDGVIEYNEI
jgi:hypothetical protein